ncbi:MAG: LysR family transcriptional regulator [Phycisphaerae bacterium]|nr:LysR family transcriptional regulator [Phycisphaerae bacterium]
MNMDVMKTFCDLVNTGSFSKAADANYVSQSAVSQQLAKLERDMGAPLIRRGGGLVAPTEAGKAFFEGAREIIRRYEQLLGEVRSAADSIRGVLRVGTIYSVGFYLLAPFVRQFLQAHPDVNLYVDYTRWSHIYASVISGEMDLGVVAFPERHRSIEIIPLASEELVLACAPGHRLAKQPTIEPSDLAGERFIAFEKTIPTRRHIDRLLKAEKIAVNISMEFDNVELLKRAIEIDAGVSILPLGNVEREVSYGDIRFVRFKRPAKWVRPLGILRHRGKAASPAEKMFLTILRDKSVATPR